MSTQSSKFYTIKEASQLSGLPSSTLRYYESIGIIQSVARDGSSGHRTYTQEDINTIDAIACLSARRSFSHSKIYQSGQNRRKL